MIHIKTGDGGQSGGVVSYTSIGPFLVCMKKKEDHTHSV